MRVRFQSSPARRGGCNVGNHKLELPKRPSVVSILTRPWGRVQPGAWRAACRLCQSRFNPHPPVGAGATPTHSRMRGGYHRFQSSPARGGGCNAIHEVAPFGCACVSILTRPWGRVQRAERRSRGRGRCARRFNPHPPVGAGATQYRYSELEIAPFQSSPARGGRVQQLFARALEPRGGAFQSSPARGGGCNCRTSCSANAVLMFQSSPARGGGCNAAWRTRGSGSPNASVPVVKVCRAAL